jgi:hypothetical protein
MPGDVGTLERDVCDPACPPRGEAYPATQGVFNTTDYRFFVE